MTTIDTTAAAECLVKIASYLYGTTNHCKYFDLPAKLKSLFQSGATMNMMHEFLTLLQDYRYSPKQCLLYPQMMSQALLHNWTSLRQVLGCMLSTIRRADILLKVKLQYLQLVSKIHVELDLAIVHIRFMRAKREFLTRRRAGMPRIDVKCQSQKKQNLMQDLTLLRKSYTSCLEKYIRCQSASNRYTLICDMPIYKNKIQHLRAMTESDEYGYLSMSCLADSRNYGHLVEFVVLLNQVDMDIWALSMYWGF